jgi:nucleoid-associated protein YgaU
MLGTTVLIVSTDTKVLISAPDVGVGVDNIAFLVGKPPGGPNASAIPATSIFWIERVRDHSGNEFDQLQYTQRVLLNFNGLSWPHVTVATMVSHAVPGDYVVNPGDTLSGIALAFYGSGSELFWRRIYDENRGVIGPDPNRIQLGQRLHIPAI